MIGFYLEDHASLNIIYYSENSFLINLIQSGIFDCNLRHTSNLFLQNKMREFFLQNHTDKILKFVDGYLTEVDIGDITVKEKLSLCSLREKAFSLLLLTSKAYRQKNFYGFDYTDIFAVPEILNNKDRLKEYSDILNIDLHSAEQELKLISDTNLIDNQRLFAICQKLKRDINNCFCEDDIEKILEKIPKLFIEINLNID